ncbi:MAG: CHAT domain-containing protein, partial [Rivularia sp. (in: cyanobacteria)]
QQAEADFQQVIALTPGDAEDWRGRGIALDGLGRNEDAVDCYDKAIEIKPDYYDAWFYRGYALRNLERYEDAVASYDKAIEIKPHNYRAWNNRGAILCDKLQQYKNAIASFDEVLRLTNYQQWNGWRNRGIALLKSQDYKAAIKTWDDGIKALKPDNPNYEKDCGRLHREKGETLYHYATEESEPFTNWLAAKDSYEKALTFLTFEKFPQLHLQVLQELLLVCSNLGNENAFKKYIEAAAQSLEKMVAECDTQGKKITLERRYAAFNQLRIDIKLQSKDANKEVAALELAETRKNTCLGWLQENWDYQPPKITYQDMQKLLNPKTAAIFWHISPNAITTFIVKHNQPTIVLSPQPRRKKKKQNIFSFNSFFGKSQYSESSKAYLEQLQSFQSWIKEWKQDYQDYCQEDYTNTAKKTAPWRKKMKGLLESLSSILEINRITQQLTGIEQLILIPHRELHLLPLDYLFPQRFNITYLPSFQIGLKLLAQSPLIKKPVSQILNVTNDDLVFNAIESIILNTIYPSCNKLEVQTVTQKSLTTALQNNSGYFHFSGHGYHVPDNPRDSALALVKPQKLTLGDIFDNQQLDLSQYELICLSACETGITSTYSLVDEYVGLASGFLAKGATYVLSTLWTVDERSTALLMIQFYQLIELGNTPTIALKQAKKWLRQLTYKQLVEWYANLSDKLHDSQCKEYLKTEMLIIENDKTKITSIEQIYAHPYYWAGFILTGKVE